MIKKITLYIYLLFPLLSLCSQVNLYESSYEDYNGFSSRSFMKFNSFLTVPTFSVVHRENKTLEAIVRSSNIEFEDASRLQLLSYSGKMRPATGAGIAVFQQEIGVFRDFGAVVNYAHQIQMGAKTKLALGFNFFYSRRGLNAEDIITQAEDQVVSNFQDIPIVNLQPAVTFSYDKFNVGLFFEDLAYFNLKSSAFTTGLSEKTISAHAGYSNEFANLSGLLENAYIRVLAIARNSQINGFSYAGNLMIDLPKAVWVKVGYDNLYGLNAGFGVNISEKLGIGFAYEKQNNLSGTNEIGLLYNFGKRRNRRRRIDTEPNVDIVLPDVNTNPIIDSVQPVRPIIQKVKEKVYDDPEHDDLSDEVQRAQDSINRLNRKVDEILKLLKNQPQSTTTIIKERETINNITPESTTSVREDVDTTLRRREETPWRYAEKVSSGGGAGTMYYVALDQFKDVKKANALIEAYKKRDIKVRKVKDPKTNAYFVYEERFGKKEDAEELKKEINIGGGHENAGDSNKIDADIQITKEKKKYKDPVYVVKVTLGASGESYKEPKTQPRAKVRTMKMKEGMEPGYYLQVNVFSKKPYADKFLDELTSDGINANYFIDPTTGYRHVYILKTDDRAEAIRLYNNNLNNSYYDRKSIVNIK